METVREIDKTLNEQAEQNILQLIKETGILMHSQITQVGAMFEFVQNMVNEMQNSETYSLATMLSYTADDLPEKCWIYTQNNEKVCNTFSSYWSENMDDINQTFLDQTSSLDNIWPSIMKLTSNVALRYHMFAFRENFIRNFPGVNVDQTAYMELEWVQKCKNNKNNSNIITGKYLDSLFKTQLEIITIAYPLLLNGEYIGCMAADLPLNNPNYILSEIYSVKYLDSGFVSIVNQSGTFLDHEDFWENEKLNKSYPELWNKLNYSDECHFFIHHYEIYRVAGYKLAVKLTESTTDDGDSWDYMVLMVVKESEIMKYRNESKDKLESASVMLIAITLTCSIITIAVVTILIHFLAKSITTPLKGIIEFTNKINAKATEKDMVTKEELDKLKEGDDQVAELVRTYKELAGSLINKKEENVPKPFQVSQNRVFPRNEMYQKNKIDWKKLLDSLSDN
jgi:hypothetical protein